MEEGSNIVASQEWRSTERKLKPEKKRETVNNFQVNLLRGGEGEDRRRKGKGRGKCGNGVRKENEGSKL